MPIWIQKELLFGWTDPSLVRFSSPLGRLPGVEISQFQDLLPAFHMAPIASTIFQMENPITLTMKILLNLDLEMPVLESLGTIAEVPATETLMLSNMVAKKATLFKELAELFRYALLRLRRPQLPQLLANLKQVSHGQRQPMLAELR